MEEKKLYSPKDFYHNSSSNPKLVPKHPWMSELIKETYAQHLTTAKDQNSTVFFEASSGMRITAPKFISNTTRTYSTNLCVF